MEKQTEISIPNFPPLPWSKCETVDERTVKDIILESPLKSCELDSLPTYLTKLFIDELLPAPTKIINKSLATGQVPLP